MLRPSLCDYSDSNTIQGTIKLETLQINIKQIILQLKK